MAGDHPGIRAVLYGVLPCANKSVTLLHSTWRNTWCLQVDRLLVRWFQSPWEACRAPAHAADSGRLCVQIVVLAAGYDTRAHRLKSSDTQVSRMRPSLLHRMLSLPQCHSCKS